MKWVKYAINSIFNNRRKCVIFCELYERSFLKSALFSSSRRTAQFSYLCRFHYEHDTIKRWICTGHPKYSIYDYIASDAHSNLSMFIYAVDLGHCYIKRLFDLKLECQISNYTCIPYTFSRKIYAHTTLFRLYVISHRIHFYVLLTWTKKKMKLTYIGWNTWFLQTRC